MGEMREEMVRSAVTLKVEVENRDGDAVSRQAFQCGGTVYQEENACFITYTEQGADGPVHNTLKVEEGQLTVIRHGAVRMTHVFQPGRVTRGHFYITWGRFSVGPIFNRTVMLSEPGGEQAG
jgi:uncharacterized beta-barrel protein YwiB (DUF1934 family)